MSRSLRAWLLGSCALALASCSDDDPTYIIITSDAGAVTPPSSDAGAAADASSGNCSGQDAITQLLCQLGLQGAEQDTGAQPGQVNIDDLLNSFGGLVGLFGGTGTTGTPTGPADAGNPFGGLLGGGAGGLFGGGTQPGAVDCASATDPWTQFFCGRGVGAAPPAPGDAGMAPAPADSGTPAAEDAGTPELEDAGAPVDDAGTPVDAGSDADAADAVPPA